MIAHPTVAHVLIACSTVTHKSGALRPWESQMHHSFRSVASIGARPHFESPIVSEFLSVAIAI